MTINEVMSIIHERIAQIDATRPENDDAELYLQGCREELMRLLGKINPHRNVNPPITMSGNPTYLKI